VDEELDANEALEDLRIHFSDLTEVLNIIAGINSIEMFYDLRLKLLNGIIVYPTSCKDIFIKYFKLEVTVYNLYTLSYCKIGELKMKIKYYCS